MSADLSDPLIADPIIRARRLSVAPMMDWTDRHCRMFHRQMSRHALLYTEMVTAMAVIHGKRDRLLDFDGREQPVALQLGGSDPGDLGRAVAAARGWGYGEVNLNVGCPSDRVQSGCFGAVLMKTPKLVADCVAAMQDQSDVPVTVKCRIGVDDQDPETVLPGFLETMVKAGVGHVIIHARKAWLQGLSPKENREIPPLDYPLVLRMKAAFPELALSINGGIASLDAACGMLDQGMDGVMIGRAAYHDPYGILGTADLAIWGLGAAQDAMAVAHQMVPYIDDHLLRGGRLHDITRHMLGLFAGQPGAKAWRRVLSESGARAQTLKPYFQAIEAVATEADRSRNSPVPRYPMADLPTLLPMMAFLMAIGAFAGVIAGLLGVGGGIVLVPAFFYLFQHLGYGGDQLMQVCLGTSLATIVVTSIRSVLAHHRKGAVDWAILKSWGPAVAAGAVAGFFLAAGLKSVTLQAVFAGLALIAGLYMGFGRAEWRLGNAMPKGAGMVTLGGGLGFFSSLMGIGGGTFGVPMMTLFAMAIHRAVATAAGFGLIIAVPASLGYLALSVPDAPPFSVGAVNLPAFGIIIAMTLITTPWGVKLAHRSNAVPLRRAFAIFITLVALNMLRKVLGW